MNLKGYGGIGAYGTSGPAAGPAPASVTQAAFGSGYSSPQQSMGSCLAPNDTGGMIFWSGLAGLVILLLIRKSLPR